ncbi:MAG: hypothetical protein HY288_20535 [Planctomycetia bacterium]|nr:hypothetical protein [Planctomycetia bacterium]
MKELEEIVNATQQSQLTDLQYFIGRYFLQAGQRELAQEYLQRCVKSGLRFKLTYALARALLRDLQAEEAKPAEEQK